MEGSVGEVAFNAFVEVSLKPTTPKPPIASGPQFKDLPDEAKTAWQAAGQAVADSVKAVISQQQSQDAAGKAVDVLDQTSQQKMDQIQGQKPQTEPHTEHQVGRPIHDVESPTKPTKTSGDA